jgi:hypothetical protein
MTISHPYRILGVVEDAFLGIAKYQGREWESNENPLPSPSLPSVGNLGMR